MYRLYTILRDFGQFALDLAREVLTINMDWLDVPPVDPWWTEEVMVDDMVTMTECELGILILLLRRLATTPLDLHRNHAVMRELLIYAHGSERLAIVAADGFRRALKGL